MAGIPTHDAIISNDRQQKRKAILTKVRIVSGCALIVLPLGVFNILGSLYPYMYSYIHFHLPPGSADVFDPAWIMPGFLIFRSVSVLCADFIKRLIGTRRGILCGVFLHVTSILMTYFSSQYSVWTTFVTLAVANGYANGLLIALVLSFVASRCKGSDVGQASGIVMSSTGLGTVLSNILITSYVNPDNLSTDVSERGLTFFSHFGIIDRMPMSWIILGVMSSVSQVLGLCIIMIRMPKEPQSQSQQCIVGSHSKEEAAPKEAGIDNTTMEEGETQQARDGESSIYDQRESDSQSHHQTYETFNVSTFSRRMSGDSSATACLKKRTGSCSSRQGQSSDALIYHQEEEGKSLKEVLTSASFYSVWFSSAAVTYCQLTVVNYFKMFGQIWIANDWFLTLTGSAAAIFVLVIRLLIGKMVDQFGVKNVYVGLLASVTVMLSFWYFTALLNPWLYFLWTDSMVALLSNNCLLLPLAAFKLYGPRKYIVVFGLFFTGIVVGNITFPFLFSLFINTVGWFGIFLFGSSVCFVSVLLMLVTLKTRS